MLILSSCDFRNEKAKTVILEHLPKPIDNCRVLFIPNENATHESIAGGKYHRRLEEFGFQADNLTVFDHTCPDVFRNLDIDAIYISGGNTFATLQKLRDKWVDSIQYKRNAIHSFKYRDIGNAYEFLEDVDTLFEFVDNVLSHLPPIEDYVEIYPEGYVFNVYFE